MVLDGALTTDSVWCILTDVANADAHRYEVKCSWEGSTGSGYETYDRNFDAATVPPSQPLRLTADPAFRGDTTLLNPEQLLVLAASACQLLSFLAVAARGRVDVVAYEDNAVGEMPIDDRPIRVSRIALRPHIVVRGPADEDKVRHLVEVGHRECFIAHSLTSEIRIEPTIEIVE